MRISIFLFILGSILILAPLLGLNITGNIAKTPESINSSRIMYGVGILAILSGALNEIKKKFEKKFKGDHKATLIGEIHEVGNYWLLEGYSTDEIKKLNKIIPKIKEEEIKILKKVKPDTVYLETTEEEPEQLKDYLPETYKLVEKLKESDIKVLPLEESYHKYLYEKICDKKKESYNIMNLFETLSNVERYLKLLKISGKKLTEKRLKEKIGILPLLNLKTYRTIPEENRRKIEHICSQLSLFFRYFDVMSSEKKSKLLDSINRAIKEVKENIKPIYEIAKTYHEISNTESEDWFKKREEYWLSAIKRSIYGGERFAMVVGAHHLKTFKEKLKRLGISYKLKNLYKKYKHMF